MLENITQKVIGIKARSLKEKKNHKLTPEDVCAIRELLNSGAKLKDVSQRYSVSESLISNIKNNKVWINYEWEDDKCQQLV